MKRLLILFFTSTFVLVVGFVIAGDEPAPAPVVYVGPAIPQSDGSENHDPGAKDPGASVTAVSQLSPTVSSEEYTASFPSTDYVALSFLDSTATTNTAPTNDADPVADPDPDLDPPSDTGVCGISQWTAPQYYACGNGGFAMGDPGNCVTGIVFDCP